MHIEGEDMDMSLMKLNIKHCDSLVCTHSVEEVVHTVERVSSTIIKCLLGNLSSSLVEVRSTLATIIIFLMYNLVQPCTPPESSQMLLQTDSCSSRIWTLIDNILRQTLIITCNHLSSVKTWEISHHHHNNSSPLESAFKNVRKCWIMDNIQTLPWHWQRWSWE